MNNILYTRNLSVGYNGKVLIDDININVEKGKILTLIGANGSGKSTILKSIARQLKNISGSVYINQKDFSKMSGQELSRKVSVLLTDKKSYELTTCRDIVESGRYPYTNRLGILSKEDYQKVDDAIKLTNIEEISNKDFNCISDGQRQRVLIARAIAQETEILILDEPTSFLDIRYKLELLSILKMLVTTKNIAVIMSLHEIDLAEKISDDILCIDNNKVDNYGTPEEIFKNDYIQKLYHIDNGYFNEKFCSVEMKSNKDTPKVFVICGNGTGIPTFRRLQRQGIPFAVGVLHENDIDYPIAKLLASKVISEKPFNPISDENFQKALEILKSCEEVICCIDDFGIMNQKNRILAKYNCIYKSTI